MTTMPENHVHEADELQLITRSVGILALLTGLAYLRAIGLEGLTAWQTGKYSSAFLLFLLLITAIVGLVVAWWREGLGGFLAAGSAVGVGIFAYMTFQENPLFSAFAYSSPFLITGFLFLCCWWRHRHRRGIL